MASRIRRVFVITLLLLVTLLALTIGITNRPTTSPTLQERRDAYERAVGWMLKHREEVVADNNSALWWMVRSAAEVTRDPRLSELVQASMERAYPQGARPSLWLKLWRPDVAIELSMQDGIDLAPYQLAMVSGLTCGATERAWNAPSDWREREQCQPWLGNLLGEQRWCATHQLMALKLAQDMACGEALPVRPGLQAEVQTTIRRLLQADPLVKDSYIQRVLMLWWTQGEQAVSPIWLRRVMAAQWSDGGWVWESQIAGWPDALQPWMWRNHLARVLPIADHRAQTDFHPTAQGLLLMALAVQSAQQAQGAQGGAAGNAQR